MIITGASAAPRENTAWRAPSRLRGQPSKAVMAAASSVRSLAAPAARRASAMAPEMSAAALGAAPAA